MGWPPGWGPCPERPALLGGVDIKGDGGYVVVPPSHLMVMPDGRDGNRVEPVPIPYRWETGCPCWLPDAPPWFAQWIATAPATGRLPGSPGSSPQSSPTRSCSGVREGDRPRSRGDPDHHRGIGGISYLAIRALRSSRTHGCTPCDGYRSGLRSDVGGTVGDGRIAGASDIRGITVAVVTA